MTLLVTFRRDHYDRGRHVERLKLCFERCDFLIEHSHSDKTQYQHFAFQL